MRQSMRGIPEFTTLVAVDAEHLEELRISAETWRVNRPEIWRNPMLVVCDDATATTASYSRELASSSLHPSATFISAHAAFPTGCIYGSQREKMLTALVFAARLISTKWYLKLDCDTLAAPAPTGRWIEPEWFIDPKTALIAGRWGYTKPADAIQRLDDWGDTVSEIARHPRLDLPREVGAKLVRHKRIISYAMFGNTEWTRRMAALAGNRLPVPSQDTYLGYCAERTGVPYWRVRLADYGWRHVGSGKLAKLKAAAAEILSNESSGSSKPAISAS